MPKSIRHATSRIAAIMLAVGLVIAATITLTPTYNPRLEEADMVGQLTKRPPAPASEAALRRMIGEIQRGSPDYDRMTLGLSDAVRLQLPQSARSLVRLGSLRTLDYLGGQASNDLYRVTFRNGSLFWAISLGKTGLIESLFHFSSTGTAQDWIDNYAMFGIVERAKRMATQFGILLATALFGRLALRLRL